MAAPVKNTCPDIDKIIINIRRSLKTAEEGQKESEKRSPDWYRYNDIENYLEDIEGRLEDLRSANASLREWGESLTSELEEAANTINALENELESNQTTPHQ
jgi:predicted nuclease with TOPRIM domain